MGIHPRVSGRRSGPSNASVPRSSGIGVRRTSQPSGSWVDEAGNPARSPNAPYSTPPEPAKVTGNPDPDNYKVVKAEEKSGFLVLKINYPDCKNYEGNKILVFQGVTMLDLVNQRKIDPHFFKDAKFKSPIARFEPTDMGWSMAQVFVQAWSTVRANR